MLLVLLVAFGPSVALMALFYWLDRDEPEPTGHVLAALGLGAAAMVLASLLARACDRLFPIDLLLASGLGGRALESFAFEGLLEEGCKWAALVGVVYRWREFDEPLDGIVYGVAVALGFGTVENVLYVASDGLRVGLLRALFAVPMHALFGATMGAFLGYAKHPPRLRPGRRVVRIALALLVAALLHGGYNLVLREFSGAGMYLAIVACSAALWAWVLLRVSRARDASPFK